MPRLLQGPVVAYPIFSSASSSRFGKASFFGSLTEMRANGPSAQRPGRQELETVQKDR